MENKNWEDENFEKEIERMTVQYKGFDSEENEENEEDEENGNEENPFDADKIRIDQQMLSVKYIYELMQSDMLDYNPYFQRKSVWKENKRKSLLIESLMLRIPIPAFYFYENEDSKFQVIDGQQRLITIYEFLKGKFKLSGLEYLGEKCERKKFEELDIKYQQRIYRTQLAVNILDARSPKRVIYDIFRRVNTGGLGLVPQEMRNAVCKDRVRDFLVDGSKNKAYLQATRGRVKDDRMDSQEMVLRFFAFYRAYDFESKSISYNYSKLSTMLDDAIEELNKMSAEDLNFYMEVFTKTMKRVYTLFGKYCFSKIQLSENGKVTRNMDYINKSLYSSFSVILADEKYDGVDLSKYTSNALYNLADLLEDHDYYNAITMGTGDRKRVIMNFKFSNEVIDKCQVQF